MTKLAVTLSLVAVLAAVHGLGGRFRSFNPELLANLGYGAYADYKHSPSVTTNKQTNKAVTLPLSYQPFRPFPLYRLFSFL